MAYRWNRKSIENETLLNGRELDISINDFIDVINNSIDRENIPESFVSGSMIFDQNIAAYAEEKSVAIDEGFCGQDQKFSGGVNNKRGNKTFWYVFSVY